MAIIIYNLGDSGHSVASFLSNSFEMMLEINMLEILTSDAGIGSGDPLGLCSGHPFSNPSMIMRRF